MPFISSNRANYLTHRQVAGYLNCSFERKDATGGTVEISNGREGNMVEPSGSHDLHHAYRIQLEQFDHRHLVALLIFEMVFSGACPSSYGRQNKLGQPRAVKGFNHSDEFAPVHWFRHKA